MVWTDHMHLPHQDSIWMGPTIDINGHICFQPDANEHMHLKRTLIECMANTECKVELISGLS